MSRIFQAFMEMRDRHKTRDYYKRVFDSPDGELVLRHIARNAHLTSTTFVVNDRDQTLLNEGARRLALSILRQVYGVRDLQKFIQEQVDYDNELAQNRASQS